jgi:hypothetical protein
MFLILITKKETLFADSLTKVQTETKQVLNILTNFCLIMERKLISGIRNHHFPLIITPGN